MLCVSVMPASRAFVLVALLACANAQCGIGDFDFSKLTKASGSYSAPEAGTQYKYIFNVCGNVNDGSFGDCKDLMCQYDGNAYLTYIAQNNGATWIQDGNSVTVQYANGDSTGCDSNRVGKIAFTCDPNSDVGTIAAEELPPTGSCQYQINFATKCACAGGCGSAPPHGGGGGGKSKSKLSGGSIFLLVVCIPFALYIIIGCVLMYRRNPEDKFINWCPNHEFWFALPGLFKDGCLFTFNKIRGCIQGSGSSESYETVE